MTFKQLNQLLIDQFDKMEKMTIAQITRLGLMQPLSSIGAESLVHRNMVFFGINAPIITSILCNKFAAKDTIKWVNNQYLSFNRWG